MPYLLLDNAHEACQYKALPPTGVGVYKDLSFVSEYREKLVSKWALSLESSIKASTKGKRSSRDTLVNSLLSTKRDLLFAPPEALEEKALPSLDRSFYEWTSEQRYSVWAEPLVAWAVAVKELLLKTLGPDATRGQFEKAGFHCHGGGFFPFIERAKVECAINEAKGGPNGAECPYELTFRDHTLDHDGTFGSSLLEILWRFLAVRPGRTPQRPLLYNELEGVVSGILVSLYESFGRRGLELYLELMETPFVVGVFLGKGQVPEMAIKELEQHLSAFTRPRSLRAVDGEGSGEALFYPFQSFRSYMQQATELLEETEVYGETSWDR